MSTNRDAMADALEPVYGSASTNLADWEGQHWVSEGHEPAGPGDKASWYDAQGASGDHYGDLEFDYWTNVYGGGATFYLLMENDDRFLTEDGLDLLRRE
jgi:hypothetical protein